MKSKNLFVLGGLAVFVSLGVLSMSGAQSSATTALVGAHLIRGDGSPSVSDGVLVLEGETIACAGTRAECPVPEGAEVLDYSGRYIMPGLVDAHVHFSQTAWIDGRPDVMYLYENYPYSAVFEGLSEDAEGYLASYLCSGVTAALDVGGFAWSIGFAERARDRSDAPFVLASGPLLTPMAPPVYETETGEAMMIGLGSPDEARAAVRQIAGAGASLVKLAFSTPPGEREAEWIALLHAVADESHVQGLPFVVHAPEPIMAEASVRAGAHMLVHNVEGVPVTAELAVLIAEHGTIVTPTIHAMPNWSRAMRAAINLTSPDVDDPNGCLDQATKARLEGISEIVKPEGAPPIMNEQQIAFMEARDQVAIGLSQANLRALYDAGVTIALGTDAGNPLTWHGVGVIAELEAMQQAGIPARDLITMATLNGARAMGGADEFGDLASGMRADLVILAADPTTDISALRSIEGVMRRGELFRMGG